MHENRKYYLITLSFLYSFYHYFYEFLTKKDLGQLWEVIKCHKVWYNYSQLTIPSDNHGTIPVNTWSDIDCDTIFFIVLLNSIMISFLNVNKIKYCPRRHSSHYPCHISVFSTSVKYFWLLKFLNYSFQKRRTPKDMMSSQ